MYDHTLNLLWDAPLLFRNVAIEQHTYSLEDELGINALDTKDTLVTVEVGSIFLN